MTNLTEKVAGTLRDFLYISSEEKNGQFVTKVRFDATPAAEAAIEKVLAELITESMIDTCENNVKRIMRLNGFDEDMLREGFRTEVECTLHAAANKLR